MCIQWHQHGDACRILLSQKLEQYAPQVIAFNGKTAYENFSQRPCDLGLQKLRLYGALVFVLPSTTEKSAPGPNGKLRYFRQLAKLLAKLQNEQTPVATVVQSI